MGGRGRKRGKRGKKGEDGVKSGKIWVRRGREEGVEGKESLR